MCSKSNYLKQCFSQFSNKYIFQWVLLGIIMVFLTFTTLDWQKMSGSGNVICTTNYSKPGLIPNNKNITEILLIWWQAVVQQTVWELSADAIMMAIMDTVKGLCGMTGGLVQRKLCESPRGSLHKVPWRAAVDGLKWTPPPLLCPLALNTQL